MSWTYPIKSTFRPVPGNKGVNSPHFRLPVFPFGKNGQSSSSGSGRAAGKDPRRRMLFIHTYYKQRGGEDVVYENELKLMTEAGWNTRSILFSNKRFSALKFLVFFFNPVSFIKVVRTIIGFKPEVIHVHNWFFAASPAVFLAARFKKVPVVHTIHNFRILCPSSFLFFNSRVFTVCTAKLFPFEAIRMKVYRDSAFYTAWLLIGIRLHYFLGTWNRIDRLVCLSDYSKKVFLDSFMKIPGDRIVVKPNFLHPDNSAVWLAPPARTKDFLYVGRLSPEKGIDVMLSAFKGTDLSLRIIGDGPLRPKLEKFIQDCPNITYLGFMDKAGVAAELRTCNALVFATIGYEMFGMVIIEAFCYGTPVIASDAGSPAELVTNGENGLHFQTGSSVDLRRKLEHWQSLPEDLRASYRANATRTYCQNYTPPINLNHLLKIYKSLEHEKNANS